MTSNIENSFKDDLERLERSVEAPIVPGELQPWLQSTAEALAEVNTTFHEQVKQIHGEQLESIGAEDSGLLSRIEQMRREDDVISDGLHRLTTTSCQLQETAEGREPDEASVEDSIDTFSADVVALVIRIRKQEAALSTWFNEALQRDRGIGD